MGSRSESALSPACMAPRAAAAIILSSPAAPDIADFFLPNREKTEMEEDVELVVLLPT